MIRLYKKVFLLLGILAVNINSSKAQSTTPVPNPESCTGTWQCLRGSGRLQGTQYMKGNFTNQPVVKWYGQLNSINGGCEGEPVIGDIDNDGGNDVVVPANNGELYAFDGTTGALLWSQPGVGAETSSLIGDANNDNITDIISVADHVYCLDGTTGNIIWTFSPVLGAGNFIETCPNMADLDNDGLNEVVVIVNDSVYAINGLNGTVKWRYGTGIPGISFNGSTPAIGDLNGDGILDVVASLQYGSNAQRLVALNGNNGSVIWSIPASASFTGLGAPVPAIGDVDGDCDLDVVYNKAAIRGDNGTIIWGTPNAGFGATYCIIADLDDNCTVEVITGCGVYRADNGNTIWQLNNCSLNGWFAPAPRVGDFNPTSPGKEIVQANAYNINNPIIMYQGITGTVLWSYSMASLNHTAEGVSIGDIDNDGCVEIVIAPDCCNGSNTILALDDNGNASNCGILASIGQVDFLPGDTTTCDCVNFRDFSSLCATSWSWQFPGGTPSTSSLQNPGQVCYSSPGNYPVMMIAHLNACAVADTVYHVITIPVCSGPIAQLTAANLICPGTCTDFTNLSVNATSYQWIFQGAIPSSSTDVNPTGICYNTPGNYDVTLIASDGIQSDTLILQNYITVYPFPAPQGISQSGDTLFANQGAAGYQWYLGGVLIPGATDYFYVAVQSGNYNVIANDATGCEVEAVIFNVVAAIHGSGNILNPVFEIRPNPVRDELIISARTFMDTRVHIAVFNILGEKEMISHSSDLSAPITIDVSQLPAAMYFLEISGSEKSYRTKFIRADN